MKSVVINFAIVLIALAAYATGFFEFFAQEGVLWGALCAIVILFAIAFKILGNPWTGKKP